MFQIVFGEKLQMSDIIQTLWVGDRLSTMEQLSLASFVKNGHEVHLYTYSDVENVPEGVAIKDGNEILPESMIFMYKDHKSYSAFSNYFRYKMLYDKGGYWVDTDMVCLKKFDFNTPFVFSSEEVLPLDEGNTHINAGVIKAPKGSPVTKHAYDTCMSKEKDKLVWGEIGPRLVKSTVEKFNLHQFVKDYKTFCAIPGCRWALLIEPNRWEPDENAYAIHLWNEMWRRSGANKDEAYHQNSLYEKLKKKYL